MQVNYFISIYHDTRRAKSNGKFPVKLRVYTSKPRKQKMYSTQFEYTEKEFNSVWNSSKPRSEFKEDRTILREIESKAERVARSLSPFTFEQFEKKLFRANDKTGQVSYHYKEAIADYKKRGQYSTAEVYQNSLNSLSEFLNETTGKVIDSLSFYDISIDFLHDYESYMLNTKNRKVNTVSIYLRALRKVFNQALEDGEIEKEFDPFGKRKYQIPASRNTKRALSKSELRTLFESVPANQEQQKAKDFWFFSYSCNGMNIKDLALLKWKNIVDDKIEFYRAKTLNSTKSDMKPIVIYLNDFTTSILEKYGSDRNNAEGLVFDVLHMNDSQEEQRFRIKAFTRFINQHIKLLAKNNGLTEDISTYWARHSFATNSIRNGASMEFMQERLGHGSIKTTQGYFAGFDDETKKEFAQGLMNFD